MPGNKIQMILFNVLFIMVFHGILTLSADSVILMYNANWVEFSLQCLEMKKKIGFTICIQENWNEHTLILFEKKETTFNFNLLKTFSLLKTYDFNFEI